MMGSLFSSISGLRNHTTWMNTIGNNISNVNTVGYKMQRVTFAEQITQMMGSASGANGGANLGGINPQQMGLGSVLGSIDTIMTQGAIQTTGNPLDVAITGEGFFAVAEGTSTYYTRAGNFYQDNQGNVVSAGGQILQGWMGSVERTIDVASTNPINQINGATYSIDVNAPSGNLTIASDFTMQAQATGAVEFSGNLDSLTGITGINTAVTNGYLPALTDYQNNAVPTTVAGVNATATFFVDAAGVTVTPDATASQVIYDSLGSPHTITWFFQSADLTATVPSNRPTFQWYAFDTTTGSPSYLNCLGGSGIEDAGAASATPPVNIANSLIWFNQDGSLASNGGAVSVTEPSGILPGNVAQTQPTIMLPWVDQAQGLQNDGAIGDQIVQLNFGTSNQWAVGAGATVGIAVNQAANSIVNSENYYGLRDGFTGDVTGSYQTIGGVNTYVPNSTPYAKYQDGYAAGDLLGLSVDSTGNNI